MKLSYISVFCAALLTSLAPHAEAGIYITAGTGRSTHSYVNFFVEDEAGRRTGRLPGGAEVAEIPGTRGRYGTDSMDDLIANKAGPESVIFHISTFPAGHFNLVVVPLATTSYWLNFSIVNDNNARSHSVFDGYGVVGTTITFGFDHQPAAGAPSPIVKVVTFASLRQSIEVAKQVGQLGDAAFVSRLDKMLAKAQSDAASGKNKQAADRLDQFIHRLDSAFKKEPDPNDGDDPDDKKNVNTMKRFIVKTALDSLNSDARTLITSLGEQSKK